MTLEGKPGGRGRVLWLLLSLASLGAAAPGSQTSQTQTREGLSVTWHDPADRAYLPRVFATWHQTRLDLRQLGWEVPPVRLEAARNAADFAARTGEGTGVAAMTRGQDIQTQRLGALAQRGLLPLTLRHEAFHAAQPAGLPRWLAEGLARIFSGEARTDPPGRTGLEHLPDAELEAALLSRTGPQALGAYREASRRAATVLRQVWWAGLRDYRAGK